MSRGGLQGVFIAALLVQSGCEPTQIQAGQGIVLVAVPITLIALALQRLYTWLWSPFVVVPPVRGNVVISGLAALIALIVGVLLDGIDRGTDDWLLLIFVVVGSSYATVYAVLLRAFVQVSYQKLYSWAALAPWLIFLPPAAAFAFIGSADDPLGMIAFLWVLPGYFGWVGVPCLVLVFLEAALRRYFFYRAQRAQAEPKPGLPRSIVVRDGSRKRRK